MLAKYDKFSRLEKPKMTLCNPNDAPIILQSGGKGTADSPYRITSVAQLVDIRNKVNSGDASYISANYILMADIDISSETPWISIGTTVNNFQGVFDGNGKSIVGLSITAQSGSQGLFGRANNATIKNLRLHGGNINSPTAASIVYDTFGNTLIEKCVSDVSFNITAPSATFFVGGLVNTLGSSSTIKNCCCLSSFVATDRDIGFGGIIASGTGTVQKCFFAGAIAETAYSSFGVISTNNNAVITDCYYDVTKRPVSNYVLVNENTTGFATELMTGSAANDNMTALDFVDVWRTVHNNYPSLRVQKQSASFMPEYGNFINYVRDESLTINFNAISELTFVAEKADKNYMYDYYRMKRQVLVNELGYFVITGVSESVDENGKKVKNITSSSCEIELNNVALPYIPKGTYKLYDVLDTAHSLLHYIMPSIPAWNLAAIDPTLAQTQRTFDDESGTVYGFLMNKIAETYECIVEYDILTRTITLTSKTAALDNTGIFLSKNNIATGVEYSENADEYANCISVRGGSDDVNIGLVNPMGSSVLYNFSYDVSSGLMSDDLIDALETWRQAVEDAEDSYYALQLERAQAIDDLVNANTDLLTKQSIYLAAVQTYDIARAGGNGVSEALEKVNTAKANYDAAVIVANQLSAAIASLGNSIAAITATLQFDQFMSNDLITELSRCMQMATYSDDNIIFTDIMSQEEKLGWMKTLYNKAKRLLNGGQIGGICEPRRQITVNTQGFVFNEKFKDSADELECGCLIAVEMPSGEVESYILQKYSINYDEKSLDLTFGNRFRPSDPTGIFKDLYNSNSDMASIVASNYIQWGEQIAKVNELELDRYRNLEINTDRVITSTTNRVTIDENGIVCKSTDPLTKEDEKYGLKIADGTILFTEYDDANDTYSGKMAVGRVVYDDGREDYGILGGSIVANTVTADKIVAGSVEKGRNLVKDGSFTNYGWLGSIGLHSVEKTGGFDEGSYFKGITDDASAEYSIKSSNRFMVTPNLDYRASFYYKATKKTGTIASCSNYNSTVPGTTKITSNAHGLSNGITKGVIISGTTDYNGTFDVTYINANSFYINKVFTSSQTGTWKYGWNAGISEIKMKVHWYSADAEASLLSTSVLGAVDGSAGWTRLNEAFVAPSNADFASVEMYVKGFAGEVDFDGIMLEQSPTLGDYSPYIGDLTARYTVINDEGVTIRNGKIRIKNGANDDVLVGDENGNLELSGKITAKDGSVMAGWNATDTMFYCEKNVDDVAYMAYIQEMSVVNTSAFGVKVGSGYPFYVRYNGFFHAQYGEIGGWNISGNKLYAGTVDWSRIALQTDGTYAIACGAETHSDYSTAKFRVKHNGEIVATSATISGVLTAGSGSSIGGFTATNSRLFCEKEYSSETYTAYIQEMGGVPSETAAFGIRVGDRYPFYVRYNGYFHAEDGDIGGWNVTKTSTKNYINVSNTYLRGGTLGAGEYRIETDSLKATGGKIGGWEIDSESISNISSDTTKTYLYSSGNLKLEGVGEASGSTVNIFSTSIVVSSGSSGSSHSWTITPTSSSYTSSEKVKKNIFEYRGKALNIIDTSKIYQYHYKSEDDNKKPHFGLVIERETPTEVISNDGKGVDVMNPIFLGWKAIQELSAKCNDFENRIKELEESLI